LLKQKKTLVVLLKKKFDANMSNFEVGFFLFSFIARLYVL